ncbi:MAG TPA: hypothetical protein DIT05_18425 [Morganella sp. (in: Bacteria)]|nr:hypothetical protein [Morganella sp. (in: enterobacteria)]
MSGLIVLRLCRVPGLCRCGVIIIIPLFIQTAGSLAAVSQPGHILMYAPQRSELAACLHLE